MRQLLLDITPLPRYHASRWLTTDGTRAAEEAIARGAKPRAIGTTRNFCDACRKALEEAGATITDLVQRYGHRRTS